jgi:hypothetical protein
MVTRQKLADSSVGTSKIIDGAVTTDKVADGAITDAKLENPVSVSQNSQTGKTELLIGDTPALIVDNEPEAGSDNLVKSGGVYSLIYDEVSYDIETGIWNTLKLIDFNFKAGKTYGFKVNSFTSESNLDVIMFTLKGEGLESLRVENKDGGYNFTVVGDKGTVTPNAQYTQLEIYLKYKNVPNPNTDTLNYDCYEVNPNAIDRRLTNLEDLAEKTSDDLEAEINRAQIAEDENADDIANVSAQVDDIRNAISITKIKDVTSQLVFIDNQASHYIKEDGSFGEDEMYLKRFKVEGGYSLDLKTRAYVNSGITSLMYAFYSSDSVFDATTFIGGSRSYTGPHVSQESFENVIIPSNAKTIVFADRGGGVTQLVITYKNIDVVKGESIKQILGYPASKTIKYIKSDGTGDYITIQEAINSITDASFVSQYELRLCNDEIYTDMTDLWLVSSPSTHNANANPTSAIAAIITKDWISIVGYGGRRKVAVYSPDSMDITKQGNVQTVYLMGNTTIDNVDFEIKNGRYAIHQESAGSISSLDHNARTILKNSNVTQLGNKTGTGYWNSCYAQANGTCSGLQLEYHNVVWAPAFYMHQNGNVETNNSYLFKNCRIDYPANGEFNGTPLGVYIGMNGSGQNPDIQFYGCDMWQMIFSIDMFDNNVANDYAHDIRSYIPNWVGCGNAIMKYPQIDIADKVLTFRTNDVNHSISVVGGTAKPLIFGDGFRTYGGTSNAWGICYGSEYIGKRGNNTVFTLGSRLGDCTTTNKTLVVKYDSTEYTLTFNEDYTNMDTSTIYQKIDAMFSALGVGAVTTNSMIHQFQFSYPMKDTSVIGRNYGTMAIQNGAALKRDYAHGMGWRLCSAGETPDGVACERINPNESGVIALFDRNYFPALFGLYGGVKPVGTMLKTGADGVWQETTTEGEAILIAVAPDCFVKK